MTDVETLVVLIVHDGSTVTEISVDGTARQPKDPERDPIAALGLLAAEHPDHWLLWARHDVRDRIAWKHLGRLLADPGTMLSYAPTGQFLPTAVGYVDPTAFARTGAPDVRHPTWQMSDLVGAVHAGIVNALGRPTSRGNLSYHLCSLARSAMPAGLRCYSEPRLVDGSVARGQRSASQREMFRFVAEHQGRSWAVALLVNLAVHERRVPLLPLLMALTSRRKPVVDPSTIERLNRRSNPTSPRAAGGLPSLDVLVPTLGRPDQVRDLLGDLVGQTVLPDRVILVEQDPQGGTETALGFLGGQTWPFDVLHIVTSKVGACHARNLGLDEVAADWVFFADDDIRLDPTFVEEALVQAESHRGSALCFNTITEGRPPPSSEPLAQVSRFGTAGAMVERLAIGAIRFDLALEHGYGEDYEFGMRLAASGTDILHVPAPVVRHLKADVGGFRYRVALPWDGDDPAPKPSPMVLLSRLRHDSKEQVRGFRTLYGFRRLRDAGFRRPISHLRTVSEQWAASMDWAERLSADTAIATELPGHRPATDARTATVVHPAGPRPDGPLVGTMPGRPR